MWATRRIWVAVIGVTAGCVANPPPREFLSTAEQAPMVAMGGWIEVTHIGPDGTAVASRGELLAVTADSLWVTNDSTTVVVATATVSGGHLWGYDAEHGDVAAGALLGGVSTVLDGAFLIFTAPMWAVGGSMAANSQSKVALTDLPPPTWVDLRPYARFPAGLPAGIDPASLRPVVRVPAGG